LKEEIIATSASGLAWTIVYIALIYRGLKDKSYGMPLVPLALNFAWELVFSIIYPPSTTGIAGTIINGIWMLCDIGILYTYFRYSYNYFYNRYKITKLTWIGLSIFAFIVSFEIMFIGGPFFGQFKYYFNGDIFQGAIFIAYIQNLIISVCFILMIWERRDSKGQSLTIGVFKCIGTGLTVGIYYLFWQHHGKAALMNIIVGVTFLLDLLYILTIYRQLITDGFNPWKRL